MLDLTWCGTYGNIGRKWVVLGQLFAWYALFLAGMSAWKEEYHRNTQKVEGLEKRLVQAQKASRRQKHAWQKGQSGDGDGDDAGGWW